MSNSRASSRQVSGSQGTLIPAGKPPASVWTTSQLTHKLFSKFGTSEDAITNPYIVATQVRPSPTSGDSTADAVIIGNWPSKGHEIQGFEIKISRADWLNEVKSPNKCEPTKRYCDRWWLLIASETFVKDGELPDDWGLMVPHGNGLKVVKDAPRLTPSPLSVQFVTGLMRANKRSHISEDLHNQYLQDQRREIESKLKKEYAELKEFVKVIKEAFGIELRQENERWNSVAQKYDKYWCAKVRGRYTTYDADELKKLIEASLSGDLKNIEGELGYAYKAAQDALEILERYKGKSKW